MLLHNIQQALGLRDGMRMTITQLGNKYMEAKLITGAHVGRKLYTPGTRVIMSSSDSKWQFVLKRRLHPFSQWS